MTAPTDTPPEELPPKAGLSGGLLSVIFVLVVAVGAFVAWLQADDPTAAVGEPAPAVVMSSFQGETFDLVEHVRQGEGPVLINLWASWCEPCLREFPVLSDFARDNPHVTVVGVAVQDREEDARSFAEQLDPRFMVGWDRDDSIRSAYPSFGLPATFAISSEGIVTDIVLAELTPERMAAIDFGA